MDYDPKGLAEAESVLLTHLENSDPPRDAELFEITEAAQDHFDRTGRWDLSGGDVTVIEELLARHAK